MCTSFNSVLFQGTAIYLCHFCSGEFSSRAMLITHLALCQIQTSTPSLNGTSLQAPQLHSAQRDILHSACFPLSFALEDIPFL